MLPKSCYFKMKTLFERAAEIRKERRDAEYVERKSTEHRLLQEATTYFHEKLADLKLMLEAQEGIKYEIKILTIGQKPCATVCISYHFKMPNRLTPVILDTKINTVELRYIPDSGKANEYAYFIDSKTGAGFTSGNIDDLVLHLVKNLLK